MDVRWFIETVRYFIEIPVSGVLRIQNSYHDLLIIRYILYKQWEGDCYTHISEKEAEYEYILKNAPKTDVSKDEKFQKKYNHFYRVRRDQATHRSCGLVVLHIVIWGIFMYTFSNSRC